MAIATPGATSPTSWLPPPPLGRAARLHAGTHLLFEGVITGAEIAGGHIRLNIESGTQRPLSANLPLRTNAAWGQWRDIRPLPWGYGRIGITPIQYSADRRIFVLLDHPIQAVEHIWRDHIPTTAWAWHNGTDSSGHPLSFLELATPLCEGENLRAQIRGKIHPHSGQLLQTPAAILGDILTHLAGIPQAAHRLQSFDHQSSHILLGGVLADAATSTRATIDSLIQSIGAAWSTALPSIASLWPPETNATPGPTLSADPLHASALQSSSQNQHLHNRIRISYDWDPSQGRYLQSLQAHAAQSIKTHGERPLDWNAPWLRRARDAQELARRILEQTARPRWHLRWHQRFTPGTRLGQTAHITHPHSPLQGAWPLSQIEIDSENASLHCAVIGSAGTAPEITLESQSSAFAPLIQGGLTVQAGAGEILFTATGENGQPLAGARITLDGTTTRLADNQGRVSFPAPRGKHTLLIQAAGYPDTQTEITV